MPLTHDQLKQKVDLSAGYIQACLDLHDLMIALEVPSELRHDIYHKMMLKAYEYPKSEQICDTNSQ